MSFYFRNADPEHCEQLSAIARAAKAHWGYPPQWLALWADDLTITPAHLSKSLVTMADVDNEIAGFCSIDLEKLHKGVCEILHMWVLPTKMGHGIGRELFENAVNIARDRSSKVIEVLSDPYAEPFYQKMGLTREKLEPSSIPGRYLPRLSGTLVYCDCYFNFECKAGCVNGCDCDCECEYESNFERN